MSFVVAVLSFAVIVVVIALFAMVVSIAPVMMIVALTALMAVNALEKRPCGAVDGIENGFCGFREERCASRVSTPELSPDLMLEGM